MTEPPPQAETPPETSPQVETPPQGGRLLGLPRNLAIRILSALVILPPAIALTMVGGVAFVLLIAVLAGLIAWEWTGLVTADPARSPARSGTRLALGLAAGGVVGVSGVADFAPEAVFVGGGAGLLVTLIAIWRERRRVWIAAGLVVAVLPCVAVIWLRALEPVGLLLVLWLVVTVIATDTGAYLVGKTIGGPRLAPRISPGKTWSGLLGGMAAAAGVSALGAIWLFGTPPVMLPLASAGLALLSQGGDLGESMLKRHFGVKDSGHLIPGHGGVLDRLDGHIAVLSFVGVAGMLLSPSLFAGWAEFATLTG